MIRHIVMWKLRNPEDAPRFKNLLDSCRGIVPGMLEFDVATASPTLEATHDVVLVSTFADTHAMQAYVNHPHHQSVAKILGELRSSREVLDYDIRALERTDHTEDPAFAPTVMQSPF